jgi:hypothetical protein
MARNITSEMAQLFHESMGKPSDDPGVKKIAQEHKGKSWKNCASCIARFRKNGVTVDGKKV